MERMNDDIETLTEVFRRLGAQDPESWARSQVEEGINQLARFVFLRGAWSSVVPPEDTSWIHRVVESSKKRPDAPGSQAGPALERMLELGVARTDIHDLVRTMQWEVLFAFCYLLEDPGDLGEEVGDLNWRLHEVGEDGEVRGAIEGLHESVLETDPAGNEMRPPKR
jgi:hypothetical protein